MANSNFNSESKENTFNTTPGQFASSFDTGIHMNDEVQVIQSRDDLSFTSRDSEGRINNWDVPHDKNGDWHEGLIIGEKYFDEVRQLASFDELEAFNAIRFAMNSGNWQSGGWGIEVGFTRALAKIAMLGMRQLQQGAVEFDESVCSASN